MLNQAASWLGGTVNYPGAGSRATPVVNVSVAAPNVQVFIGNEQITGHVEIVVDGKLYELGAEINRQNGRLTA